MSSEDELSNDEVEVSAEEESEEEQVVVEKKKRKTKAPAKKGKDPDKPKRNMSAFFLYSNANRARIKEENPDASFGDLAKLVSQEFKALPAKEKSKWEKKAEQDKARYDNEMSNYVAPEFSSEEDNGKKKKKKKDPNAPKRNMSAYFLYSTANRALFKEQNPDASFGELAKIISVNYKGMPEKERKKWDKKAAEEKERYNREMEAYRG